MATAVLVPHECAVRQHCSTTTELVRGSLKHFGLLMPPVYNVKSKRIIALRSAVEAVVKLDWKEIPVWCVELDEAEEAAAMLMLNSHLNEWDWEHVSAELNKIQAAGLPLTLTGLPESDTGPLLAAEWKPAAKAPLDDVHMDANQGGFGF